MSQTQYAQLDAWIDAHFDEQVKFLQALVQVPTDTPPGNNAPHAERTAELLHSFGYEAEKHAVPSDEVKAYGLESITNLIVRRKFADGGKTIALNAHGDVVPPGEGWVHDPYGGEIEDGKIYGRAAAVSKCDFSTFAFAVRALESLGLPLKEEGDFYGYSLALGSAEVSLLNLTNAYRSLANGGRASPTYLTVPSPLTVRPELVEGPQFQ